MSSRRWRAIPTLRACWWSCSTPRASFEGNDAATQRIAERIDGALNDVQKPGRRPHHPPRAQCDRQRAAHEFLSAGRRRKAQALCSRSSSTRRTSTNFRSRARMSRSSSMPPTSKACICASARWRAAASAGPNRREDFRTEILGLVKAQQVKNAVIVPVGAKGGFYPKAMPLNPTRDQSQAVGNRGLQGSDQRAARHHRQYRARRRDRSAGACAPA